MSSRTDLEREFWDKAALDPEVDTKFISDISTQECIDALELPDFGIGLDIGCGVGRISSQIGKPDSGRIIYGLDISQNMIDIAKKRDQYNFYLTFKQKFPKPINEDTIDFAYCILVFQHMKKDMIQNHMRETFRVLKHGGIFRFQFIEGEEDEPFSNHYELNQMKQWVEDAGLEFVKADKGLCHYQWTWVTARKPIL